MFEFFTYLIILGNLLYRYDNTLQCTGMTILFAATSRPSGIVCVSVTKKRTSWTIGRMSSGGRWWNFSEKSGGRGNWTRWVCNGKNIRKQFFRRKSGSSCFSSKTISLEMHKEGFQPFCFKNINLTLYMIIYLVVVDIQIHVAVHINALYSGRDIKLLLLGFLVKMLILV